MTMSLSATIATPCELEEPATSTTKIRWGYMCLSYISVILYQVGLQRRSSHSLSVTDPNSRITLNPTIGYPNNLYIVASYEVTQSHVGLSLIIETYLGLSIGSTGSLDSLWPSKGWIYKVNKSTSFGASYS